MNINNLFILYKNKPSIIRIINNIFYIIDIETNNIQPPLLLRCCNNPYHNIDCSCLIENSNIIIENIKLFNNNNLSIDNIKQILYLSK